MSDEQHDDRKRERGGEHAECVESSGKATEEASGEQGRSSYDHEKKRNARPGVEHRIPHDEGMD